MAEKIKKGFFKVLPWSVVILLIIGVSIGLLNSVPKVQPVKAALGDGASSNIQLFDINGNGKIDRITVDIANPNTETWQTNGAAPNGFSVTQAGNAITISSVTVTSAITNPAVVQIGLDETDLDLTWSTNGVTASVVELIYTQTGAYNTAPNINDSTDEQLNAIATGDTGATDTEIDKAAPVPLTTVGVLYRDITAVDGQVDRVDIEFSEIVQLSEYDDADWSFPTAGSINLTNESLAATAGNYVRLTVAGDVNETGGAVSPTVSYSAAGGTANSLKDTALTPNNAASFGPITVIDWAAPVPLSYFYLDTGNDGTIDRVDITFSEPVQLSEYDDADWSFPTAGDINLTNETAAAVSVNQVRLTTTGDAWETGCSITAPTVQYNAAGGTANSLKDNAAIPLDAASFGPSIINDDAAPVAQSAPTYKDINGDGAVDRIDITMSADAGMTCTFNAADWSIPTPGTINANTPASCAVVGNDLRIGISADASETGGAVAPTIQYTNNADRIADSTSNATSNFGPLTTIDRAAPAPVSALYKDTDSNGTVDRVDVTMTADVGLACAFEGGDWSIPTAGTITVNTPSACAVAGNDIRVTVAADANETGGATNPTIRYQNLVTAGSVVDGAANQAGDFGVAGVTATDSAAPTPVSALYKDTNTNGTVDRVDITMTADVGLACTFEGGDWSIPTAGTITVNTPSACAISGNDIRVTVAADANETGGAINPTIRYQNWATAGSVVDGAANQAGDFGVAGVTATDGATPVRLSALYKDANGDGTVDRVDVTMSADVGLACTWNVADWSFPVAGTVNVTGSSACAISGNDIRLTVTGTTAATTGGASNPTVVYTNNANRVTDGAANNTATWAAVTATDGAAPVPVSAVFQDLTGPDGQVDRIFLTMSNDTGLALTAYADLDWTITPGSVGLVNETQVSVGGLGLSILTLGTANVTGGGVNPAVAYTNNANRLGDGSGNFTATFGAVAATDNAAPVIVNTYSADSDADGDVNAIDIAFSENISDATVTATRFEFDNDSTNNAVGEETASGGSTTVVYPAANAVANNQYYRLTITTGIAGTELAYLHMNTAGLQDLVGNAMVTGNALGTENDRANPVIMTTSPANIATDVDVSASVAITFSEAMTTGSVTYTLAPDPGGVAVVWSGGNTIATYSHTAFNTLTLYTFTDTAGDSAAAGDGALSAGPVANPFTFTTLAGGGGGGGGGGLPASVTVTTPNGGETLTGGGTYNITWLAPGVSSTIDIYYSLDSGINFPYTVATAQTNDGSYTWTVPNISSSTVKIKAVSGSLNDISDSNFVITYTTPTVSVANSTIVASPTAVVANGTSFSIITVTVKDAASVPLSGKVVTLASSRGTSDTITTVTGTTGADGKATFNVYSSTAGTSTYNATAQGTVLTSTVSVVFTAVGAPTTPGAGETPTTLSVGDLIKSPLSTSVYYYGSDNKRHVFPNEKTYKSWYVGWSNIKIVTASQLQGISLGHNVTVRPGTVLVKIQTDPKVYAVEPNGLLRWVPTEARAKTLYGDAWATKIIDVPLVFWGDYTFGSDITTDAHPTGALVKYAGLTDTYYIQGAEKRLIATESAFNANRFQWANVLTIPTALSYTNGTDVTAAEDALVRIY